MKRDRAGIVPDTLVAVPAPGDPFVSSGVSGVELVGRLLSVLQSCPLERVILIQPSGSEDLVGGCVAAIAERHPGMVVDVAELAVADLGDPVALRKGVAALLPALPTGGGVTLLSPMAYPQLQGVLLAARPDMRWIDVNVPPYPSAKPPVIRTLENPFREGAHAPGGVVREPGAVYVHRQPSAVKSSQATPDETAADDEPRDVEAVAANLGFVSEHPAMRTLLETVDAVAQHQVPILIQGETGTGKGLCARLVHAFSPMRAGPFVAVNCGALPEQLIESQLFGHCQGAFTGATRDQAGKFEQAHGGTLFLDEIGELPLPLQPKLLRVLEDGLVEPLGSTQGRTVNVRIIAATNRDLRTAVARREFREDLYYRLAFAVVSIPSLRDRRSDIPGLALQFLSRINASMRTPRTLSPAALNRLSRLPWHGNVRDLENVIGRSVLLAENDVLTADDLVVDEPLAVDGVDAGQPKLGAGFELEAYITELRRQLMEKALIATDGNQRAASALLGVSRQAVSRFVRDSKAE